MRHIQPAGRQYLVMIFVFMFFLGACGGGGGTQPAEPPTAIPSPTPSNSSPEIVTLAGSPKQICPGEMTELVAVVVDDDGDPLSYVWSSDVGTISNQSVDSTGGQADYLASAVPGDDTIELTVSDGKGGVTKKQTNIVVRSDCTPVIEITAPKNNLLTCPKDLCQIEPKGTTSSIISRSDFNDLRLYVLVFPIDPPGAGWYIQLQPGSIQVSDGFWSQSPSWLGSEQYPVKAGDTLKLVAVIVSTDATAKTINGTRSIEQMTGKDNDNVVKSPNDVLSSVFILSNEVNLTVEK